VLFSTHLRKLAGEGYVADGVCQYGCFEIVTRHQAAPSRWRLFWGNIPLEASVTAKGQLVSRLLVSNADPALWITGEMSSGKSVALHWSAERDLSVPCVIRLGAVECASLSRHCPKERARFFASNRWIDLCENRILLGSFVGDWDRADPQTLVQVFSMIQIYDTLILPLFIDPSRST
jgi:hypothetical protein